MLPLAIQLGSIVVGRVVAHGISQLLKDQKYKYIKSKYIHISYNKYIIIKEVGNESNSR